MRFIVIGVTFYLLAAVNEVYACGAASGASAVGTTVATAMSMEAVGDGGGMRFKKLNGFALKSSALMRQILAGYKIQPSSETSKSTGISLCTGNC